MAFGGLLPIVIVAGSAIAALLQRAWVDETTFWALCRRSWHAFTRVVSLEAIHIYIQSGDRLHRLLR